MAKVGVYTLTEVGRTWYTAKANPFIHSIVLRHKKNITALVLILEVVLLREQFDEKHRLSFVFLFN